MHYGPGVDSASNRNEYQEYFLGGKGGRCLRLTTYHHPVPLSRNLGTLTSWNPLGLSRPVMGLIYLYTDKNPVLPAASEDVNETYLIHETYLINETYLVIETYLVNETYLINETYQIKET